MTLRADSACNIVLRLGIHAAERPQSPAIVDGTRTLTFAALDDETARLAAGLQRAGIRRGTRVVLMVPPGIEMVALAFALFRGGALPVFVDPGVGWEHLKDCLAQARPDAFIGTPKAHLGRVLGGWGRATIKTTFVAHGFFPGAIGIGALREGADRLRAPHAPKRGDWAAILYTSGSTGTPKGAVYTHDMLNAQTDLLARLFEIRPGEVSVPTFPLFALFDAALGLTAVMPRMDFTKPGSVDPGEILGKVLGANADQLFGSPALIDRVGRHAEAHGIVMPSLKRVLSAGAPVSAKTLARFDALVPNGRVFTPYGATEALPVACASSAELLETAAATAAGAGVCVGKPVPEVEVKVIPIADGPVATVEELPRGQVGELAVRGPVVSAAYFEKPEADALAKIPGGWHRMGDLGYFDEEGRLWLCGRKSQRVGELFTDQVEGVFNAVPGVRRSALVKGKTRPVICVEKDAPGPDEAALRALAEKRGLELRFHPGFPVDARHNAKIKREKLAEWVAKA